MAIKDEKQKIFGKIAALRTLNEGYPEFNLVNSFPSINNTDESIAFLVELIISLLGSGELKNVATDFLTTKIGELESKVKSSLIKKINGDVTMGSNPSIPSFLVNGFDSPIKTIDFFNQLKVDPKTNSGNQLYNDTSGGVNSTDFNTFLFEAIQGNTTQSWGSQTTGSAILDLTQNNDSINIKINSNYLNNKTLSDFTNDYVNSVTLFNTDKLVSKITDKLFGTVSNILNKTQEELLLEAKLNDIFESFINAEDDVVIDDSFFSFTNEQIRKQEEVSSNRANGVSKLFDCGEYNSSIPYDVLTGLTENIKNASTLNEKKDVISTGLNTLADYASSNASDSDKQTVKSNFFKELIKVLVVTLIMAILTPQLILLLLINSKLFDSLNVGNITDVIDVIQFIKDNRALFKSLVCNIKEILINLLLSIVVKEIIKLVKSQVMNKEIESGKNKILTMLSLMSVPQDVLAIIRGL